MDLSLDADEDAHLSVQLHHNPPTLMRAATTESTPSRWTVSDVFEMMMKLDKLVRLIQSHRSLQLAEIVLAEGYKEKPNGILHRFLILKLKRTGKDPVWLRMDRRMDPNTKFLSFLLASSQSPAYDTVGVTLSLCLTRPE